MLTDPRWVKFVDAMNRTCGQILAGLLLAMTLVTVLVVVLRYGFSIGHVALQEAATWMYAGLVMLGAGFALLEDGHVRVDLFYRTASPRAQRLIDRTGILFLLLPLCVAAIWTSLPWVLQSWKQLEGSREAGGLPGLFLLKSTIPLGALLLALQGLTILVRQTFSCADTQTRESGGHG